MTELQKFLENLEEYGITFDVINGQGYFLILHQNKKTYFSAYTEQQLPLQMMEF